jgi:hypothetical protein
MRRFGAGVASAAAIGAMGAGGLMATSRPASGRPARVQAITDADVFNFALNLEYLEAEYYLRAVTGAGLASNLTGGTGTQGSVTGGALVPFQTAAVAYYAQRIANDELAHVTFIRDVLGGSSVAEPTIDLETSFTTLAVAAGLIANGQTFNPFASEVDFLLGAYIFEDVGVTAYAGAASVLTNAASIDYAASVLATEAYHAGAIRGYLSNIGGGAATNAISALRQKLGGVQDLGTDADGNPYNITNVDINGQAQRRTPQEVLSIVYGGGTSGGLFFPAGMNGAITMA